MTKTKRKRILSIIHPHRHVKEETAFQWLQRVQTYKRLAFQNPIHFPYLCIHSNINATTNTNTITTNTNATTNTNTCTSTSLLFGTKDYNHDNEYSTIICTNNDASITNRFHVTNENIIRMNSNCFFLRMNELNELRMKSKQWQRRQRKIRILSSKKGRKQQQQQQQQRMDGNTSNHCTNKNRNDLSHDDNYYYKFEKLEKELLDSCFVKGTGITFIDQLILQYQKKQHKQQQHKQQQQIQHPSKNIQHSYKDYKNQNNKSNVIEILGRSSTGKSQILMSLAANYVAFTTCNFIPSNIITNNNFIMESSSSSTSSTMSPIVIIIDPEHSIHVHQLKNYIVSALLRRWNATDSFRHNYQSIAMSSSSTTTTTTIPHDQNNNTTSSPSSMHLLDQQVLDALDRIHIIRPTDVSNGYVATLECLYQSLHELYHTSSSSLSSSSSPPPIMLLMDSVVSAFDATDKMYESMGVGLSGRHEFIRQLKRLQQSFDIELIATRTIRGGVGGGGGASNTNTVSSSTSNHGYSNYNYNSSLDGWNKMITSRITLEKALSGSQEMNNGFPFVAITSLHHEKSENSTDIMQWSNVIPFRVSDTDGIKCQSSIIVGT